MEGTLSQPYLFAAAMYVGMLGAAVYFLFAWARRKWKHKAGKAFLDVLYCLFMLAATAGMLYVVSDFRVRGFYFVGIGLGFLVYCLGIRPMMRILGRLMHTKHPGVDK